MGQDKQSGALAEQTEGLKDLFDKDPEELTEADINRIIEKSRKTFALFAQSEAAKATKPKASPKQKISDEAIQSLTVDDLF